jgi:hypothetical protein
VNVPARGLKFSAPYPLNAVLPKELKFFRRLWLDICARSGGYPDTGLWDAEQ